MNNFDHKIYYILYDDLQVVFNKDDYDELLNHYLMHGKNEKRICSIDDIILPSDFYELSHINNKYS